MIYLYNNLCIGCPDIQTGYRFKSMSSLLFSKGTPSLNMTLNLQNGIFPVHSLVFSRQENECLYFDICIGIIQDGFDLFIIEFYLMEKFPLSDKQCSVRDAMDVLTPAPTHRRERDVWNGLGLPKTQRANQHCWALHCQTCLLWDIFGNSCKSKEVFSATMIQSFFRWVINA